MARDIEALTTVYDEVCRAHDGIADFRAKLLTVLPFASGRGINLLLGGEDANANEHLGAIGLFGAFVTIGLFIYELREIQ
ncbi:hypothetical protein [Candidatus Rhodobacter oscarellae]|uniref:hypothetical protein n=1 Tax=Candidatus Rhodobacter oscarellae TaxID=1675527 RepID=UPI00128F50C2|nr:hypothetical protein [Candidatus Rhodobacter lobularis]